MQKLRWELQAFLSQWHELAEIKHMIKNTLSMFIAIALSASLVACSTNTPKQNVGLATGAIAGGLVGSAFGAGTGKVVAIGAGAVVGALLGGAIGKSMDESDNAKAANAMNNQAGMPTTWVNSKTGATYTVVPGKHVTVNGNPNCRHYYTIVKMHGKQQKVYGIACPMENGTWQTVR